MGTNPKNNVMGGRGTGITSVHIGKFWKIETANTSQPAGLPHSAVYPDTYYAL